MGMVVRTNVMAINANRSLGINNSQVSKNLEKLSSGFRINRAADDSAGLAISEKMKAQIKGLEQASLNSQDGISLVQTAEGALTEVHDMLNRMKELATKSGNGTIQDSTDREAIQKEVNKLNDEINRIAESTNFNGINLLDGSLSTTGGSSAASNIKYDGGGTIADVAAVKGADKGDILSSVAVNDGDFVTITVGLSNGKSISVDLIKKGDFLVDRDGKTLGSATTAGATAPELGAAALAAFKNTEVGKNFDITNTAGVLQFTAKEAGTSAPQVTSFAEKGTVKSTGTETNKAQKLTSVGVAADAFQTLDITSVKTFDGTNADTAVFTVNGKKFAVVAKGANAAKQAEILDKLDKDVNYVIAAATGASAAVADRQGLLDLINQKTGLELTLGAGDLINLKAGTSGVAGSGGLSLQIGDTGDAFNKVTVSVQDMSAKGIGTANLDVSTETAATDAIETIKNAINYVSGNRSELGALQNRLEHTINNLDVAAENMTSANSRIRDTDMAKQMMEYTKMNVLTQSAQAMLAQANQQPQSILQLLQ